MQILKVEYLFGVSLEVIPTISATFLGPLALVWPLESYMAIRPSELPAKMYLHSEKSGIFS